MELLVSEIARGDDEDVPASIQIAVEVTTALSTHCRN